MQASKDRVNLKIKDSLELETERVFEAIQELDWFETHGYKINLPKKLKSLKDSSVLPDKEAVKNIVTSEYKKDEYKKIKIKIEKKWTEISEDLCAGLRRAGFMPSKLYFLTLTKYGTGGSYHWPDKITLNFRKKSVRELMPIIAHEIIHLLVQSMIEKYQIQHWQKEHVVDLILARVSPSNGIMQELPIKTKEIDKIFNEFFPDIDMVLRGVGGVQKKLPEVKKRGWL